MRSHRQSRKGQLVIIAALIILILMLTLVLSISRINLSIQELEYEPVQEIVLGITSDFDRCLTYALSLATHRYNITGGSLEEASQVGNEFIMKWIDATLNSYSNLGLNVTILNPQSGATDIAWLMDWDSRVGVSCVFAEFRLDVDAYGFKGWMSRSLTAVFLNIMRDLIDNRSIVIVEFQIIERKSGSFEPISNLTVEDLRLTLDLVLDMKIPVNITSLTYQGNGIYIINGSYTPKDSIQPTEISGVTLSVITPDDNVLVSASTSSDEWRNIFLAENGLVTEAPYIPHGNMFLNPTLSHGQPCRIAISGNTTENITLKETIFGTLWLAPTKSVQLNVTIGFTYNSIDYIIGYDIITATSKALQPYYLVFDAKQGKYPEGYYLRIPEGSKIFIDITLIQSDPPGVGSIKIYFGYNQKGASYLSGIRFY